MILFFLKKDPIYLEREGQPTSRRRVFINVIVGARRPKKDFIYFVNAMNTQHTTKLINVPRMCRDTPCGPIKSQCKCHDVY